MKHRLLFLTFYYPPDLSAGSFRSFALIDQLLKQVENNWDIDVLTTMPNRYSSYFTETLPFERKGNVKIRRILLPDHQSGMWDQAVAFSRFAQKVMMCILRTRYEAVFATTSRLATGVLGALIAKRKKIPFYLDVRDIFTETIEEVFGNSLARFLLPIICEAERYALRTANRVNLVSEGFLPYFREQGLGGDFKVYPNGIDEEFIKTKFIADQTFKVPKVLLYAGNIGEGQGLHRIIPELALKLGSDWIIRVVGDGGKRWKLEEKLQIMDVTNVERFAPVSRSKLMDLYREADVLFLHLNDFKAFRRVLPSKIFEYAATGKPILAGVAGYPASFLNKNITNSSVFPPCDSVAGVLALKKLNLEHTSRREFVTKYSRETIVQNMVEDMLYIFDQGQRL